MTLSEVGAGVYRRSWKKRLEFFQWGASWRCVVVGAVVFHVLVCMVCGKGGWQEDGMEMEQVCGDVVGCRR